MHVLQTITLALCKDEASGYLDMPERKPPDPTPAADADAGGGRSIYRTAQKLAAAPRRDAACGAWPLS